MIKIGILSDTHLYSITEEFRDNVRRAFSDCGVIIHAGDITELPILSVFEGKEVYAVCGNCCGSSSRSALPETRKIVLGGYGIGICHGAGNRINIEGRMYNLFADMDCIIFGHTHQAVITYIGKTLLINPGEFRSTGRYGAGGTYAILTIDKSGLNAAIHEL
ncbi:MAG: YfcE family phosphodiesterase [Deltaproteobacteria bacterium]|nr:MAG: YfcE family phosphodiesterase [Deltaproteobacteria bacterium]